MKSDLDIRELWSTQNNLHRFEQLPVLCEILKNGFFNTKICLQNYYDDIIVNNGHHRLVAIMMTGRFNLLYNEYFIIEVEESRGKICRMKQLYERYRNVLD